MAEQSEAVQEKGESGQEIRTPVSEEAKEAVVNLVMRRYKGESMAEIFGVDEDSIEAMEFHAYRLYRSGQNKQAKIAARGILALDTSRALCHMIVGDIALGEFDFRQAADHLGKAHELQPEELEIRARLAEALLHRGKKELAIPHLKAVIEDSDDDSATAQRCRALLGSGTAA